MTVANGLDSNGLTTAGSNYQSFQATNPIPVFPTNPGDTSNWAFTFELPVGFTPPFRLWISNTAPPPPPPPALTVNVSVGVSGSSSTWTGYSNGVFGGTYGSLDNPNILPIGTLEGIVTSAPFGSPPEDFTIVINGSLAQNAFTSATFTVTSGTFTVNTASAASHFISGGKTWWYWTVPDLGDYWGGGTVQPVTFVI